ncbi:hypothetical protein GALMADRAFT_1259451 [Galerina marginata CBS 339.88]|uniref:Uncharacterized protein n=1 Tax=Galerina marginata (strain CBS 339.88) TaxID=685588 RepID=A0A067T8E7_GALM3|nr:hypothetical protein GALMADRAFT_1259451 [Galerina marginata CBS 339.88]
MRRVGRVAYLSTELHRRSWQEARNRCRHDRSRLHTDMYLMAASLSYLSVASQPHSQFDESLTATNSQLHPTSRQYSICIPAMAPIQNTLK